MSPFAFVDIEMYSDQEEDLQALYAELAEENGADDELPPIIQDEVPTWDNFWGEAA